MIFASALRNYEICKCWRRSDEWARVGAPYGFPLCVQRGGNAVPRGSPRLLGTSVHAADIGQQLASLFGSFSATRYANAWCIQQGVKTVQLFAMLAETAGDWGNRICPAMQVDEGIIFTPGDCSQVRLAWQDCKRTMVGDIVCEHNVAMGGQFIETLKNEYLLNRGVPCRY